MLIVRPCVINQSIENQRQFGGILWTRHREFIANIVFRGPLPRPPLSRNLLPRVISASGSISNLLRAVPSIVHIVQKVPVAHIYPFQSPQSELLLFVQHFTKPRPNFELYAKGFLDHRKRPPRRDQKSCLQVCLSLFGVGFAPRHGCIPSSPASPGEPPPIRRDCTPPAPPGCCYLTWPNRALCLMASRDVHSPPTKSKSSIQRLLQHSA